METDAVRQQYERRKTAIARNRYCPLRADVWQSIQERQRVMLRLFAGLGVESLENVSLVEVGCGAGNRQQ